MTKEKLLVFSEANHPYFGWGYEVYNKKEENIASIRRIKTGQYIHWNVVIEARHLDCANYLSFSPGCQDEMREMCRKLKSDEMRKVK